MAVPFQVTANINLEDVLRGLWDMSRNLKDAEDDSRDLAVRLQRELGRAETLRRLVTQTRFDTAAGPLTLLEAVGDVQRSAFLDMFDHNQRYLEKLRGISPRLAPAVTSTLINNIAPPSRPRQVGGGSRYRYAWAAGGKSKAEKLVDKLKTMNNMIHADASPAAVAFLGRRPEAALPLEKNQDAETLGMATILTQARIQSDVRSGEARLLRDSELEILDAQDAAGRTAADPISRLRIGRRSGMLILVESRPATGDGSFDRALQLATFLNQRPLADGPILRCGGLYRDERRDLYRFYFEMPMILQPSNGFERGMANSGFAAAVETPVIQGQGSSSTMSNLIDLLRSGRAKQRTAQELKSPAPTTNASEATLEDGLFRHAKFRPKPHFPTHQPLTLAQRLQVAHKLASAVYDLHLVNWLHQNINSFNIWFLIGLKTPEAQGQKSGEEAADQVQEPSPTGSSESPLTPVSLRGPYLLGFDFARKKEAYSDIAMSRHFCQKQNIYRHPDRWIRPPPSPGSSGPQSVKDDGRPAKPHTKEHDAYALGVVLLEIGMGMPAEELLGWMPHMDPSEDSDLAQKWMDGPGGCRDFYLFVTGELLPEKMGGRYAALTAACLKGHIREEGAEEESFQKAFRVKVVEELGALIKAVG